METTAINNLNCVIEQREKMINAIIFKKYKVNSDKQFDSLYKRYNNKSYSQLVKIYDTLF